MKNKKLFTAMVVFAVVMSLAGCAKESGKEPDAPIQIESSAIEDERESKEEADGSDTQRQEKSQVQTPIPENDEGSVEEQTDAQLEEELKSYRQEREDMIQEGMIGLFKAIRDYDCGRDASFYTFADLCISRQMYTAVQASHRQKHWPLNTYVSLYGNGRGQGDNEELELAEALPPDQDQNPETLFIDRERVEYLEGQIDKELSSFEKQVLDLYLTGMSYSQIARVLGREEKSTDNALQRLKGKIKKML